MNQFPDRPAKNIENEPSVPLRSNIILLDLKQWAYVQKCYNLTPQEARIAELICQGIRNGSIAKALRIKPGTVKTHTRNIYRKLRVSNKIAMLLRFIAASRDLTTD